MEKIQRYLDILECPVCHRGDLSLKAETLLCVNCLKAYKVINGIPDLVADGANTIQFNDIPDDFSYQRWDEFHCVKDKQADSIGFGVLREEHLAFYDKLKILDDVGEDEIILDIGCGRGYIAYGLVKRERTVIGIDYILKPLLFAKSKFEESGLECLFIRADMFSLPFKKETVKFAYSLGVLEHHRDIKKPVSEIFRVLKTDGFTFNVVPAVSLSSLTYGQLWGSIPNIRVLREVFYFFHYKLLKGIRCIYGFELNYLRRQLNKLFKSAGFSDNKTGIFDIALPIYKINNSFLKQVAKWFIKKRVFTRHIFIYSKKEMIR